MPSFADRVIASRAHLVHKLKARDSTGRWAYYFVMVEPARERAFLDVLASKTTIDLDDFGKVIASCYGEGPTDAVRRELKERFGFDDRPPWEWFSVGFGGRLA